MMKNTLQEKSPVLPMAGDTEPKPIICLMGPTASGKTLLAMEMVKHLPCDIISVDSAMVYRGMDIGTAKPDAEQLANAPHRLINIRDPADSYSVAQFCSDALTAIQEIHAQGRLPLLVGGTMMYFHSLQQGLATLPQADLALREQLDQECASQGLQAMYAKLDAIDPNTAQRVSCQDWRRIQRALEVYYLTGQTMTQLFTAHPQPPFPYSVLNIVISPTDRQILRDRIAARFLHMLQQGFIAEVEGLFQRQDLNAGMPALQAAGYKQIWQYLQGKMSEADMQRTAITASCQLAKRQLTWLRHWEDVRWLESDAVLELLPQVLSLILDEKCLFS